METNKNLFLCSMLALQTLINNGIDSSYIPKTDIVLQYIFYGK